MTQRDARTEEEEEGSSLSLQRRQAGGHRQAGEKTEKEPGGQCRSRQQCGGGRRTRAGRRDRRDRETERRVQFLRAMCPLNFARQMRRALFRHWTNFSRRSFPDLRINNTIASILTNRRVSTASHISLSRIIANVLTTRPLKSPFQIHSKMCFVAR